MTNEYTALQGIQAPGTAVFGYQRGDAVTADVVSNWDLKVGSDVCEGDLLEEVPTSETGAQRPDDGANYATWQAWAIANGMPADQAEDASMDDLQGWERPDDSVTRPADSANKATWVAYVEANGADKEWAEAGTTTKADLQNWQVGDMVAVAASEALND